MPFSNWMNFPQCNWNRALGLAAYASHVGLIPWVSMFSPLSQHSLLMSLSPVYPGLRVIFDCQNPTPTFYFAALSFEDSKFHITCFSLESNWHIDLCLTRPVPPPGLGTRQPQHYSIHTFLHDWGRDARSVIASFIAHNFPATFDKMPECNIRHI